MLDEFSIIEQLKSNFSIFNSKDLFGIGDDAAVIFYIDNNAYVISTDSLVENRHFRLNYYTPEQLAHKCLHVNLSDLAAMGAKPRFVLLNLAVPLNLRTDWVQTFLNKFSLLCQEMGVIVIGGDTTASGSELFINLTVIGECVRSKLTFRNTAKPGDMIMLAGRVGYAYLGLTALEKGVEGLDLYKNFSLLPKARVAEALWLGEQGNNAPGKLFNKEQDLSKPEIKTPSIHELYDDCDKEVTKQSTSDVDFNLKIPLIKAAIDISDGLYLDAANLAKSSKYIIELNLDNLDPDQEFISVCEKLNIDPWEAILGGGEDYSLLFSVNPTQYEKLMSLFEKEFGYKLICIGHVTDISLADGTKPIKLVREGHEITVNYHLFSHFGEL